MKSLKRKKTEAIYTPEYFLSLAVKEAEKAYKKDEVPIGAVIVKNGKIISKAHNLRQSRKLICTHAELLAIEKACKKTGSWRLDGCEMYSTIEPCIMCAGAIHQSRIKTVYYGSPEPRFGFMSLKMNIHSNLKTNHRFQVVDLQSQECSRLIKSFFKEKRLKNKSEP